MNLKTVFSLLPFILCISFAGAQNQVGYFMHPDLKGDQLVLVAEGDIWRVPTSGGNAIRSTSHPGDESDPKISPDGKGSLMLPVMKDLLKSM